MKNNFRKWINGAIVIIMLVNIFSLIGCGKTEDISSQADQKTELESGSPETEQADPELQTVTDTEQI